MMTRQDVAAFLGVTMHTIKFHRRKGTMPEPDVIYGKTPLWKESTIRAWDKTREKHYYSRKVK